MSTIDNGIQSIRVKIRLQYLQYPTKAISKTFAFEKGIEFWALLKIISAELGVPSKHLQDLSQWRLFLGGNVLIEETEEIDDGDELVLFVPTINKDDIDDDSSIEDITEEILVQRRRRQEEEMVIVDDEAESEDSHQFNDDSSIEDVTDQVLAERIGPETTIIDEKEATEDSFSGKESLDKPKTFVNGHSKVSKPRTKRKRPPVLKNSPIHVCIEDTDIPVAPGKRPETDTRVGATEEVSTTNGTLHADQTVKDRVMKLLNTGFHETSNENEAKNAMKLAQRLMQKHNLSQALLLKEREAKASDEEQPLKGGMVKLKVINRRTGSPAAFARWIAQLTAPICRNFQVECFHSVRRSFKCDVTFYGICTNAQLAGYAFKVATERISSMSSEYVPHPRSNATTRSARLSYALGIVSGISKFVDADIEREDNRRRNKWKKARHAASSGEAYVESDLSDEDETPGGLVFAGNVSESETLEANGLPTKASPTDCIGKIELQEVAVLALIDHREKVSKTVLEEHNVKLRSAPKRASMNCDSTSFKQGVKDAEEIDINQRALRNEVK